MKFPKSSFACNTWDLLKLLVINACEGNQKIVLMLKIALVAKNYKLLFKLCLR